MKKEIVKINNLIEKIDDAIEATDGYIDDSEVIIKLKVIPDDIHEAIALLHTYNKHSFSSLGKQHLEISRNLIKVLEKMSTVIDHTHSVTVTSKKTFFTTERIPYIVASVFFMFMIIWVGYVLEPEATIYVVSIIKDTLLSVKNQIIKVLIAL